MKMAIIKRPKLCRGRVDQLAIMALFLVMLVLARCASEYRPLQRQVGNLTFAKVKEVIVEGQTTQAEILETFGSPNIMTKSKTGLEVWTYSRMSYDSTAGFRNTWGGSSAFTASASNTFDLIVKFDDQDVVVDYKIIATSF